MGLLPRHDAPALGRGAPRHDGRGRLRQPGPRLGRKLVMVNSTWSRALNTQLTPKERHAVLYFIEQGLMPKTGKRFEWEVGAGSQRSALRDVPGLRLGRRGAARAHRPRLVRRRHAQRRRKRVELRRPMLEQGAERLGPLEGRRASPSTATGGPSSIAPHVSSGVLSPMPRRLRSARRMRSNARICTRCRRIKST